LRNETINWKPKSTGEGRFGNWIKNANDWNLSFSILGNPLPIWRTRQTGGSFNRFDRRVIQRNRKVNSGRIPKRKSFKGFEIGNMDEANYDLVDLHKNVVDEITLVSASGKPMKREADLIDVWFDSGSMPYAQWHYPLKIRIKLTK
jgi:isoleucyl-tRNA synthetase